MRKLKGQVQMTRQWTRKWKWNQSLPTSWPISPQGFKGSGGSSETGSEEPGDEEKPLKADSSASESKEFGSWGSEEWEEVLWNPKEPGAGIGNLAKERLSAHQTQQAFSSARMTTNGEEVSRSVLRNRAMKDNCLQKLISFQRQHQNEQPARVGHGDKIGRTGSEGSSGYQVNC